jgi:hypothetical protein
VFKTSERPKMTEQNKLLGHDEDCAIWEDAENFCTCGKHDRAEQNKHPPAEAGEGVVAEGEKE